jgi:uncharacterized delta-60 repeat protein
MSMCSTSRFRVRVLGFCLVAAAACGDVKSRGDEGGDDGASASFSVVVDPGPLYLHQGESASLDVEVARDDEGDGQEVTVAIDPEKLPAGVTAEPLTIAAADTAGTLALTASADAAQGAVDLDVSGTDGEVSSSAALRLLVAGAPGTVDLSFADQGVFIYQISGMPTSGNGLALQPDGKILVTGSAQAQAIALRLDATGAPDPDFGSGGLVSSGVGDSSGGIAVAVLDGGAVVLGGWGGPGADIDLALFGFTADGAVDEGFAEGGADVIDIGVGFGGLFSILQQSEALVTVGTVLGGDSDSAHVARYSIDGQREADFGGTVAGPSARAALPLDARRIAVAGGQGDDFWLARFDSGDLDAAFGISGATVSDLGGIDLASGLVPAAGGRLLVVGTSRPDSAATSVLALALYNASGYPDLAFGASGQMVTDIPFDTSAPSAAALDGESRILIIGRLPDVEPANLAVLRLLPDGTLDDSFGDAGRAHLELDATPGPNGGAHGVAIDPDGRIVVSGEIGDGTDGTLSLVVTRLWP